MSTAASTTAAPSPVFGAARIAELMADSPERVVRPTPEQAAIIEQPLGASVLVLAGAGSGKTETMAGRVVWLVANGLAAPSQILGLTFTRKAAGELGERVVARLQRFAEGLAAAESRGALTAAERRRAAGLRELMEDGLELPEVSTYNAFASGVVQEFGGMAGVAATGSVIDQATAWGIAREIVCGSDDPELATLGSSIATLVRQTVELDHAVSDNLTSLDEVERVIDGIDRLGELPYNDRAGQHGKRYADIGAVLENMRATAAVIRLARAFAEEKRRRGAIEFSDQLALAVETLGRSGEAVRTLRRRTPVVLLDEVQDTSVGQTALLSMLFSGASVMGVGDPHQSIYGFRGASAANLRSFHLDFAAPGDSGARPGRTLGLTTSWRNPTAVLAAANAISAPLAAGLAASDARLATSPLTSRAQLLGIPETGDGAPPLEARFAETLDEEFEQLAHWMRDARERHAAEHGGELPSAAVLFRKRAHMPAVSAALSQAGVPNRIVGLGGLLATPEVTDVVSALRCLWYADADGDLIRLLAGPRFRLGVADLAALGRTAAWFAERDHAKQRLSDDDRAAERVIPDPDRQFTLLDAVDEIASIDDLEHAALRAVSPEGRRRLREAGRLLRQLRQSVGGDILALLRAVEHALRIDIELEANELGGHHGAASARANLDAFADLVDGFLSVDPRGTLASVLVWLERAAEDDEAAEHVPEPEAGTVQLITGHGAKGLEWDLVAVPRLVEGEFPGTSREGIGWLRPGQLPDELRGDAAARPALDLFSVTTQKQAVDAIAVYRAALAERHGDEERRLAYVAVTRAASRLLLTGSFWGGQSRVRGPSVYLRELADAGLIDPLPERSGFDENPQAREGRTVLWPPDPLGARAAAVRTAAAAVRAGLGGEAGSGSGSEKVETDAPPPIDPVVELLLAERASTAAVAPTAPGSAAPAPGIAALPERVNASSFHEFVEDPQSAERRRLRPLPVRPYRRTRLGNRFHEWVERRTTTAVGTAVPLIDFEPGDAAPEPLVLDFEAAPSTEQIAEQPHELQQLIDCFERSRWAELKPVAVELEITLPFAGRRLVCKLDAVYRDGEGDDARYEVVDWKSGRPPRDAAERASRFLQLDLYRHAYAQWSGIDPERIDVTLFYVAEGEELRGEGNRSLAELEELWLEAAGLA